MELFMNGIKVMRGMWRNIWKIFFGYEINGIFWQMSAIPKICLNGFHFLGWIFCCFHSHVFFLWVNKIRKFNEYLSKWMVFNLMKDMASFKVINRIAWCVAFSKQIKIEPLLYRYKVVVAVCVCMLKKILPQICPYAQ